MILKNALKIIIFLSVPSISLASQGFVFEPSQPEIFGRLFIDAAWAGNENSAMVQFGDDIEVRALRLGAKGRLCNFCDYKAEVDFAGNNVSVKDALFSFDFYDNLTLSVGQFKPFFSLEELTSSRHIIFLERGLPNVFAPSRRLGIGLHHHHDLGNEWFYTLSVGGFGESVGEDASNNGNQGYYAGGRGTLIHQNAAHCYVMAGINGGYERSNTDNLLQIRARPESNLLDTRMVDTGVMENVKDETLIGVETAAQIGQLGLQGEVIYQHTNRRQLSNVDFNGFYVLASFFLTPDFRPLNASKAVLSRVKPTQPYGAVELAMRLSYLDLTDNDVIGGHERNVTLGINWYLNSRFRVMGNVIKANASRQGIRSTPLIGTVRIQGDFG